MTFNCFLIAIRNISTSLRQYSSFMYYCTYVFFVTFFVPASALSCRVIPPAKYCRPRPWGRGEGGWGNPTLCETWTRQALHALNQIYCTDNRGEGCRLYRYTADSLPMGLPLYCTYLRPFLSSQHPACPTIAPELPVSILLYSCCYLVLFSPAAAFSAYPCRHPPLCILHYVQLPLLILPAATRCWLSPPPTLPLNAAKKG
jgi:hypothetical protein